MMTCQKKSSCIVHAAVYYYKFSHSRSRKRKSDILSLQITYMYKHSVSEVLVFILTFCSLKLFQFFCPSDFVCITPD